MKTRLLIGLIVTGSFLAGCSLQQIGAPIYNRADSYQTGTTGVALTGDTYTVQPGDTLYSIAVRNGCNPTELARANGITDPTLLSPGTVLRLTSARTQPVVTVSTPVSQQTPTDTVSVGEVPVATATTAADAALQPTPAATQKTMGNTRLSWPVARGQILRNFEDENSKGVEIAGNMGDDVKAAAAGTVLYTGENVSGYGKLIILSHGPGAVTVYGHNSEILVQKGEQVTNGQVIAKMGNSDSNSVNLLFEVRHNDRPVNPLEYLPQ